jgi:pyruvate dehydrogenase E2 component (dihydrolipoamide acetyltransferase)
MLYLRNFQLMIFEKGALMIKEIKLPKLSKSMGEGAIADFFVKPGDEVKKGQCIFEVETDKACIEIESPQDGFVKCIIAELGQALAVDSTVMILADKDETVPQEYIDSLRAKISAQRQKEKLESVLEEEIFSGDEIVIQAASEQNYEIKPGSRIPLSKIQILTARRMAESKKRIPCFYLNVRVDVTDIFELRTILNERSDLKISYNDFLLRAVGAGLEHFPVMTGRLEGDVIQLAERIGIGLAISANDAVFVPVVKDANKKNLVQIAADRIDLTSKAESGNLLPVDLEDACITISNLGSFGVSWFIPIVVPGQCSIIGVGQIIDTPRPNEGGIKIRKMMNITLSVDHRITNGSYATEFLDFVRKFLEDASNFQ